MTAGPPPTDDLLTFDELQLATRNRGMPLEALRWDVTPAGLHYLLVHFDIPAVDPGTWRLAVGGHVDRPLELTMLELRELPAVRIPVTLECAGNGRAHLRPRPISQPWLNEAVGTALWTGVRVRDVLERAGVRPGTAEVVFTGADHGVERGYEHDYARSLSLDEATRPEMLLAYEMNDAALPPQHGAPLRLVAPGWYGMASVKWLVRIDAVTEPFGGYQQAVAYRYRRDDDDPGEPVTTIRVRALMIPPGFPDFLTRRRTVDEGAVVLEGRAWAGRSQVVGVEVGVDGDYRPAELGTPPGPFAWVGWRYVWDAKPGDHVLSCRATDSSGRVQPTDQPWNLRGMGNNLVQRVEVSVRPTSPASV